MKKYLKVSFAELNKVLNKYYTYIGLLLLIVVSFICLFSFSPAKRQTPLANYSDINITTMLNKFNIQKGFYDSNLQATINKYVNFGNEDLLGIAINEIDLINNTYEQIKLDIKNKNYINVSGGIQTVKQSLDRVSLTVDNISSDARYLVSKTDYKSIIQHISNEIQALPSDFSGMDAVRYQNLLSYLINSSSIDVITKKLNNIYVIASSNEISGYISNAIVQPGKNRLTEIDAKLKTTYLADELSGAIDNYIAHSIKLSENIKFAYQLKVHDELNKGMNGYVGYEEFNHYLYNSNNLVFQYALNNNIDLSKSLDSYSFNTNSGNATYSHDYIYYSLEILKYVIIIICMVVAVSLVSSETMQNTIKLTLIKPIKRSNFLHCKYNSVFLFSLAFILVATFVNIVIGFVAFPASNMPMFGIIFGKVFYGSPYIFLLCSIASIIFETFIFITIAMFFSSIFKSNIIALISSILFVAIVLITNIFVTADWFIWLPFNHINLFKYSLLQPTIQNFGAALSSNVISTSSLYISIIYDIMLITVLNIVSFNIFKRRDY